MKSALCLILVLVIACFSYADIIHVPGDYPTIQAGIDAAWHGDVVLVANGTYTGSGNKDLDFNGKAITVTSENGAENCIIDCENDGRGFYFHSGETEESVVNGFTIRNGSANKGGGIFCEDSSPTVQNNNISGNSADSPGSSGGGIYCYNSDSIITNNNISGNSAVNSGGGIKCLWRSPVITYNTITLNSAGGSGGGIYCDHSSATLTNNTIIENSSAGGSGGGGIFCDYSFPIITNNTIEGNSANDGGGIYCYLSSSPMITNTILWNNSPEEIYLDEDSSITITYSDIQDGWEGETNIDVDPMFVDPDNGDYHLQVGSPCIDAGDPNSPKDPDGTRADIGAFYYDQIVPTGLEKLSGDNQSGIVGTKLPEPLVVLVKDQHDNPMPDVQVFFAITQGNGSVNPTSALTDADGKASTELTLGQTAGLNQVTATVNELSVIFNATGIELPVATTVEKVSGDNQSGNVGSTLPNPLVVHVLDQNSNPMAGVTVTFEPSEGASVNPTEATTDENGEAQTMLTLGAEPGEYTVTASVEGLDPVVFTATAIDDIPDIFNVYPSYGYVSGGTEIVIAGANFKDEATVTIGGRLAHDVTNPIETTAWLTSDRINITDEAPENVQLLITLDEGVGPTTETITFSTSGISLAQVQVETTSQTDVLRIIIQTAIDNRFGVGKITVSVSGSDTTAQVTFTTVAIGADVRLSIEQQAGSDILFSEPMMSSGLQIHATTPEGTVGAKTVVVTNPDGESATFPKGFVYLPLTGDVSGDGTISAYDAALILQYVVGLIDQFPATSPIGQAAQKYAAGEITVEELDRILQKWGYPSVFKLLGFENQLLQNYPNPFNPETWIPFKLAQDAPVTISIYDTKGQLIRTISLGNRNAGIYTTKDKAAYWDGRDSLGEQVSSGVYFYTLQAGEFRATRKMVILK